MWVELSPGGERKELGILPGGERENGGEDRRDSK